MRLVLLAEDYEKCTQKIWKLLQEIYLFGSKKL